MYLLLLGIFNFSPTQRVMTHVVESLLENKLKTDVSIEKVEVGLFNRVILHNTTIKDLDGRTLLSSKIISAKIEIRSLLPNRPIALRSVSLLDTNIKLIKSAPNKDANFQFIIDAFKKKEKKEKSQLNLRINSLILRRVNVSYDELWKLETPHLLNMGHLSLKDINANISLKHISTKDLDLRIRDLNFKEKSGFTLYSLSLKLQASQSQAQIKDFEIKLPHSIIKQHNLTATYQIGNGLKNILETIYLKGNFSNASISLTDLSPLSSYIQKIPASTFRMGLNFSITPKTIRIGNLNLSENHKNFYLSAKALLQIDKGKINSISSHIHRFALKNSFTTRLVSNLTSDTLIQSSLNRVGDTQLNGDITYRADNGVKSNIFLQTQVGNFDIDGKWEKDKERITSQIQFTSVNLSHVFSLPTLPELLTGNGMIGMNLHEKKLQAATGKICLDKILWKDEQIEGVDLKGSYKKNGEIAAEIKSVDNKLQLQAATIVTINNKKLAAAKIQAEINRLQSSLFTNKFGNAIFAGNLMADINKTSTKGLLPYGELKINDFKIENAPRGNYNLQNLDLKIYSANSRERLSLHSDFADAEIEGILNPKIFIETVKGILCRALPNLLPISNKKLIANDNSWKIKANIKRSDFFENICGLDFSIHTPLTLNGIINNNQKRTFLTASTDSINIKEQQFGRTSLFINGSDEKYQCLLKTNKSIKGKNFALVADFQTRDSLLVSQIDWTSQTTPCYEGTFKSTAKFRTLKTATGNEVKAIDMQIYPTDFLLADTVWHIASGSLSLKGKELSIDTFRLSHFNQSITASGQIIPGRNDSIVAKIKDMDVDYILGLANFHAVEFGGFASGNVSFTQRNGQYEVDTKLHIPYFTFNKGYMGETDIKGGWKKSDNCIRLDANMKLPNKQGEEAGTKVLGFVDLTKKGLKLDIEANHTNLQFLRCYMDGIFDNFDGDATGNVQLYGPFKALDFVGKVNAEARARIISTGVFYNVKDGYVDFAPGIFSFHNFNVTDDYTGIGKADGNLRHTHLKNLNYDFSLTAQHLLCYDKSQSSDMPFYSTTTGTGNIQLNGRPGLFTADINLRPDAPTTLVYTMGSDNPLSTNDAMIQFHSITEEDSSNVVPHIVKNNTVASNTDDDKKESSTDVFLHFLIDATPSAQIKIITDSRTGDAITAYGNGPIRAMWHNKGNFEMYGTYTLSRGTYKLSLQDFIRKDLTIDEGSTLTFSGNPLEADLGLKARYTVNGVSLNDLNYGAGFSQKSVKVDCILNIGGKAKNPQVSFDIDLQGISEDEKQMVRKLIATDEDMNRQAIYLLGIGRFYTTNSQNASTTVTTQQQSSAAMRSFLSTTLTSQLNSAISSALGNDSHWSFGTNVATGTYGWNDMEVEGLLQGRLLNDRLLINGNFGYRDRPTYTSNFVGDFDIRYLLTPFGNISLRAYSETNDRYFTKSSLTTQGIGLTLQKEFNIFKDLLSRKKKVKNIKNKETK